MSTTDRPPLVRLTWRMLITFLVFDSLLTLGLMLAVVKFGFGASLEQASPRAVLDAQVAAWNRGNLEEFMDTYWRSDELTFYSTDQVVKGWQATLDRYRKRYRSEGKEMGRLEFADLSVTEIGADSALARGRWKLTMKDNSTMGGLFTLILRRIDGRWRIIHDHTSAASEK